MEKERRVFWLGWDVKENVEPVEVLSLITTATEP